MLKLMGCLVNLDSSNGSSPEEDDLSIRKVQKVLFPSASKGRGKITGNGKAKAKETVELDSSDEEPLTSPLKRRRKAVVKSDDDDSDIVSSPLKRRRPVLQQLDEEDDDEEEEEEEEEVITRKHVSERENRGRGQQQKRRHRSEKEKKLELLKRKRAGEDLDAVTDSSSDSDGPRGGIYDSDANSDLLVLSEFEDEEEYDEEANKTKKSKKLPSSSRKNNKRKDHQKDENQYDSDFVVDDDEGPLGVPVGLMDIPLEFTHQAHKPLKEHFRDAVELVIFLTRQSFWTDSQRPEHLKSNHMTLY